MATSFREYLDAADKSTKTDGGRTESLTTDERVLVLLEQMSIQLSILNKYMSILTDTEVTAADLDDVEVENVTTEEF